jgi:hypothetical protein
LLIGAWYRREMAKYADSATQLGVAAVLCRGIDYVSRLSQWLVREKSADGSGGARRQREPRLLQSGAEHISETGQLRPACDWFAANLPDYWSRQRRVIELLDYIAGVRTPARVDEAATARALRGAVDNRRP